MALTTNLLAYWKMEWNSNDSVWSNNGTDTAITYSSGNGKISQGAWFNGSTSRIQLPTNTFLNSKTKVTFNYWVTFNDHLVGTLRSTLWVQTNYVGAINSQYQSVSGTDHIFSFATAWTTPWVTVVNIWNTTVWVWYMLTHTFDTVALKVETFLNWTSMGSQTFSVLPAINVSTVFDIWRAFDTTRLHNWNLDEFGIWDRVLNGSEITQLYNWWLWLIYPFIINNTQSAILLLFAL